MTNIGTVEATYKLHDSFTSPLAKISAELSKSHKKLYDSSKKLAESYSQLAAKLDPAIAREQEFQKAQAVLDAALRKGIITQQEYNTQIAAAERQLRQAGNSAEESAKKFKSLGTSLSSAGSQLTRFTAPLAAAGIISVKFANDFNAGMANVASLIPESSARIQELKGNVQDLAVAIGKSTGDLTGGLYQTISAFGDTSDTLKILDINARAATAGVSTTLDAINLTSAVTKGYGDTTAAAVEKVSDLALLTVRLGQTTFPELAASIGRVTPLAAALGVKQEELFAGFATLTGVTGTAAEVSTQLQAAMANLLRPTAAMKKALDDLGISSVSAAIEQRGLVQTIRDLLETTDGSEESVTALFRRVEGLPAIFALSRGQAEVFDQKLRQMADSAGVTATAFREQSEGINEAGFRMKQAFSEIQVASQQLGDVLAPLVAGALGSIASAAGAASGVLADFPPAARTAAVALGAIVTAAGPALFITGQLITAWGTLVGAAPRVAAAISSLVTPINALGLAIAGLLLLLDRMITKWREAMQLQIETMVDETNRLGAAMKSLRDALREGSIKASDLESAKRASEGLATQIERVGDQLDEAKKKLKTLTADQWYQQSEAVKELEKRLTQLGADKANLDKFLELAGKLPVVLDEGTAAADGMAGPPGGIEGLSDALKDALKSITDTTASNRALLAALLESQDAHDKLNALLEAGVPLAAALTGAYDDEAEALLRSQAALKVVIDQREEEARITQRILDLQEQLAQRRDSVIDTTATIDQPGLGAAANVDWSETIERVSREGSEHFKKIQERSEKIAHAWATIADLMADSVDGWNDGLAQSLRTISQMVALFQQIKQLNEQGASAWEKAAAGAALGGSIAGTAQSFGLFKGQRGTGSFGGQLSGDYSSLGGQVGGAIGSIWGPWGAAIGGVIGTAIGGMIKQGADDFLATIEAAGEDAVLSIRQAEGGLWGIGNKIGKAIIAGIESMLDLIDGTLEGLPNIQFKIRDDTIKVWVGGLVESFKDAEEAVSWAVAQALKQADIGMVSPEVLATLQNTVADSAEELAGQLQVAIQARDFFLGEDRAAIRRAVEDRVEFFWQEVEQGIIAATGRSAGLQGLVQDFLATRNQLLGIQEDPGELARRRAQAFQAELEVTRASLLAIRAEILAKQAEIEATGASALAYGTSAVAIAESAAAASQALGGFAETMAATADAAAAAAQANAAALAAVDTALAGLAGLDLSQADIDRAVRHAQTAAGGGRGQRAADLDRLNEVLDRLATERLPTAQRAMEEFAREWAGYEALAHGNAEALARLNAEMEEQRRILVQGLVEDVYGRIRDLERDPNASGFSEGLQSIADQADQLRADFLDLAEALDFGGRRIAIGLGRIANAEREHLQALAGGEAQDLLLSALEFLGRSEEADRLRFELAKAEFQVRYAELQAAVQMYHLQIDSLEAIGALVGQIAEIDFEGWQRLQNAGGIGGGGGSDSGVNAVADALRQLREIQARSLSPFMQALRGVVDEFAHLRSVLGWTAEVQAAYAQEIRRVLMDQLEPIKRLQDELAFRSGSSMRSIDQFRLAQRQLTEAQAALEAGDLSQLDKIPDLARRVLELNPAAQASKGNRFIESWVNSILDQAQKAAESVALAIEPGGPNDPFAWLRTDPTAGDQAVVTAIHDIGNQITAGQDDTTSAVRRLPEGLAIALAKAPKSPADSLADAADRAREAEKIRLLKEISGKLNSKNPDVITLAGVA